MDIQEPTANYYTDSSVIGMLTAWIAVLVAGTLWVKLFQNAISPSRDTTIIEITEANFGGYTKQVVSAFSAVNLDGTGTAYAIAPLKIFQCDGTSSNTINGAYMSEVQGVDATATNAGNAGNYSPTFVITAAGSGYQAAPIVHLTGATGANATAHAIVVGGVVTSIVLDDPGNGAYTTYTVVIDPPENLLIVSPFANPQVVQYATDAIPYIQQVAVPSLVS